MKDVFKAIIKGIVPKQLIEIYRLHGKTLYYYRRISSLKKMDNYSILLGTPLHENLGDHLITIAERKFLQDLQIQPVIEIPIEAYKLFKKKFVKNVKPGAMIFIQGGGWMGTVWLNDEVLMQDMLSCFKSNQVVVFPQTSFYDCHSSNYLSIVESGKKVYSQKNVVVSIREYESYNHLKQIFPNAKTILQPDITLYLKKNMAQKSDRQTFCGRFIGICFRKDRESYECKLKKAIIEYLNAKRVNIKCIDTIERHGIAEKKREEAVLKKIEEFSKFDLIITDRLHGMIISYLAGTRCIALDNRTHKVRSVYQTWMNDCGSISYVENYEEFVQQLGKENNYDQNIIFDFSLLKRVITYGKNQEIDINSYSKSKM